MVIPDTQAHLDGHTVITQTYHIYKQTGLNINGEIFGHEEKLDIPDKSDPNYVGYISFDVPDKLFSYYPEESRQLESHDVTELIRLLSEYRGNPIVWRTSF